jgi:hypothetical protein
MYPDARSAQYAAAAALVVSECRDHKVVGDSGVVIRESARNAGVPGGGGGYGVPAGVVGK